MTSVLARRILPIIATLLLTAAVLAPSAGAATETVTLGANLALPAGSAAASPPNDYYIPNANLFPGGLTMPAGHAAFELQIDMANVPATDEINLVLQFFYGGVWNDAGGGSLQGGFFTNKAGQLMSINSFASSIPTGPYPSAFRLHVVTCPRVEVASVKLQLT